MTSSPPMYIDATMLLRWQHLAPVGIVRLERLLAAHLRFRSGLGDASYVVWDKGYRPADTKEVESLDELLKGKLQADPNAVDDETDDDETGGTPAPTGGRQPLPRRAASGLRKAGFKVIGRFPAHLRPMAEQAAWTTATLGVESARHVKRLRSDKKSLATKEKAAKSNIVHRTDFSNGADLVALGLGWEYLDHEAMYLLKQEHGVRIHMPAFDLIPVTMPQMNFGQSHLVHRYYAEMAHYADSITSISYATRDAIAAFFELESLPVPHLAVNQLPGIEADAPVDETKSGDAAEPAMISGSDTAGSSPRHRFEGEQFVLSVSTIEIRKNHVMLAKVWHECIREGTHLPKLVLVGRYGWDIDELHRWVGFAPELEGRFVMCTDVEDDELVALYQDAVFTVFPSRAEGWGLPITESLAYGKVCIHSTDPAQFEASQSLMPALHPDDFLGWKAEIIKMYGDAPYRASLEQRIIDEYVRRTPVEYCADFEAILADRRAPKPSALKAAGGVS